MPWVKIDDDLPDNPKVDRLSDGAFRLYIYSLCHAQKHMTDGKIIASRAPRLMHGFRRKYLTELLEAGLWESCNGSGDYLIHDFVEFNRTRDYWEKRRVAEAQRLADWRARKGEPK